MVLVPGRGGLEGLRQAIEEGLSQSGFRVSSAGLVGSDSPEATRKAVFDVREGLRRADLVVADITDLDASVMYELGVADGMDKRTIVTMARPMADRLPYNLMGRFVLVYDDHGELSALLHKLAVVELESVASRS